MKKVYSLCILLLIVAFGCRQDDEKDDPGKINNSVTPNDFLAATKYTSLNIEIVYVEGFQPTAPTIENLKSFLLSRLNKPSGINVTMHSIASPGYATYSVEQIRALEKVNRTQNTKDNALTAYLLFADADYAGGSSGSKTLGIAFGNSSMCVFEKAIREFSGGVGKPSATTVETTVINHEFGHVLGLVSNGTPLQSAHQDGAHPGHCDNQDCLMYYLAETSGIASNLFGGSVPGLDASCLADLKANGGK